MVGKVQFNAAAAAGNGQVADVSEFREVDRSSHVEIQTCQRDARIGSVFSQTQLLNTIMSKPSTRYDFFIISPIRFEER